MIYFNLNSIELKNIHLIIKYIKYIFFYRLADNIYIIKAYSKRKSRGLCAMKEEEK